MKNEPIDINGKDLRIGDWVKVISVPLSICQMPDDSKDAFSRAVGENFQIADFDEIGCLELDFPKKLGGDFIWIEPYCVKRIRRYKEHSIQFKRLLELKKELERSQYIFSYKVTWPEKGSYENSLVALDFQDWDIGRGWSVSHEERYIAGNFSIYIHKANSLERIYQCRQFVLSLSCFEKKDVGEVEIRVFNKAVER
jgi:hypothetical protein